MQLKTINMLNDAMFKSLFRSIEARSMVASFLHEITGIEENLLKNANYQGGELVKKNLKEKKKEADIIIKINDHNQLILEMNQYPNNHIFEKNTSYAFSVISESIPISAKRYPTVILINLDYFNKYQTKKSILHFKLRDEEGTIETEMYDSYHLILENIVNEKYNKDSEIQKVVKLLMSKKIEEMIDQFKGDEKYMAAIRKVEDLSKDPNFVGYYDKEEAHKWDLEDMRETGYDEGMKKAKIEIAQAMLKNREPIDKISKYTNLTVEEIMTLN